MSLGSSFRVTRRAPGLSALEHASGPNQPVGAFTIRGERLSDSFRAACAAWDAANAAYGPVDAEATLRSGYGVAGKESDKARDLRVESALQASYRVPVVIAAAPAARFDPASVAACHAANVVAFVAARAEDERRAADRVAALEDGTNPLVTELRSGYRWGSWGTGWVPWPTAREAWAHTPYPPGSVGPVTL